MSIIDLAAILLQYSVLWELSYWTHMPELLHILQVGVDSAQPCHSISQCHVSH